jgi:hypothetical protein
MFERLNSIGNEEKVKAKPTQACLLTGWPA